jgi:hypothetical protein
MDEGDGQDHHVTPGVSRLEIAWRGDRLRVVPRWGWPPAWVDGLILALLAAFLIGGIGSAAYSVEEAAQLSLTRDAGLLVTHPDALLPGSASTNAVQERVRIGHGSFTRYVAAPGWYLAPGPSTPRPLDLGSATPGTRPPLVPVSRSHLVASRAGPAVLAALSLLMLFLLARRLAGRSAATIAVLLFGVQPAVLLSGRQVGDAGVTALFGLGAVYTAAGLAARLRAGGDPGRGAWMSLAVTSGLCLAAGLAAVPYLAGALAFCGAGLIAGEARRRTRLLAGEPVPPAAVLEGLGWVLVSALGAVCVWVACSPSLWGWLPERLAARHDALAWLSGAGLRVDSGPDTWTAVLAAWRALFLRPAPALLMGIGIGVAVIVLIRGLRAGQAGRGRTTAVALLIWLGAVLIWFLIFPSGQPDHLVPVLAVGSVLIATALTRAFEPAPGREIV